MNRLSNSCCRWPWPRSTNDRSKQSSASHAIGTPAKQDTHKTSGIVVTSHSVYLAARIEEYSEIAFCRIWKKLNQKSFFLNNLEQIQLFQEWQTGNFLSPFWDRRR
jgi:isopentenyldiphosphate isomerase